MIVVVIIGILAAIALPAFSRYVAKSKTAEAVGQLNRMWAGSVAYYEADHFIRQGGIVEAAPRQFPGPAAEEVGGAATDCCAHPGGKCPGNDVGFNGAVWQALEFSLSDPYRYKPFYESAGTGPDASFTAQVRGNLDCDAVQSVFFRYGMVLPDSGDVGGAHATVSSNELE